MSQRALEALLRPKSIAVIGASMRPERAGYLMMRNLLAGGFNGPVLPVTPKYKAVCGVLTWPDIASLPFSPDLAVICTHASRNPQLLKDLGERGCKACIILSAPPEQMDELRQCASRWQIRLLGPNSLGVLAPRQGLNASFSPVPIYPGKLAFISQSAAVSNTILDWAQQRKLGFSWFIALGDSLDIDADDLLDFLTRDGKTTAVLLYLEHLNDARRFVSAARSAARNKPVLVIKSGRSPHAQQLLGARFGMDGVWDAAIQRAGLLRVQDTHELFSAVETLSYMQPLRGERLMIVSNGAAPAALALDALDVQGGKLATLGDETLASLQQTLPQSISIGNPLNLKDDATINCYQRAIAMLLDSRDIDALLVIYSPSAVAPATATARHLIELVSSHPRAKLIALLTNWCGEFSTPEARRSFSEAGIPTYRTPEGAVTAFMHMVKFQRNQKQLRETPALPADLATNTAIAHQLIQQTLDKGICSLDTFQVQHILQAYGLKTLPTWIVRSSDEAVQIAQNAGFPVTLTPRSSDISAESEISGAMFSLRSVPDVRLAAGAIIERVPQAKIEGIQMQSIDSASGTQALRIVMDQDPVFGPIIMLGEAGIEWQADKQAAIALPPLNMTLARYLIIQAIKQGKIRSHSACAPLDIEGLSSVLVQVSNLIVDCPEIMRLDIRTLMVTGKTFSILDVAMQLAHFTGDPDARLAIRPYPQHLEETVQLKNGETLLFRPILPEDELLLKQFIARVTKEDLYYRYFSEINEFTHDDLANMTQIDYDREMAIVAVSGQGTAAEIIGVTRAISDADNIDAEFSVLVRSDLKGLGLGSRLLEKIIACARQHGLKQLNGITMPGNRGMISLARKIGFDVNCQLEDGIVSLSLRLDKAAQCVET
ncbi:bifunctional acetate--CoA ligase family protein/GNAT family N-acetyltransferase [Erwinia tracheiphila]|uniref:GNAT family N-acetyltransferase n=1 Tax=Erwinia tracheiphila TaxID=65700 RepID=A0A345CNX4_9GAMM|nr:bifunctional acetate--CoA ligase family protein/GNAT family N-acetyltransferase [Erwinia tracheiphila]AXF75141.1 GNAT family N-acetyltransferase [Erwinia tracheiphila]UIA82311.1 bifunctional acetate--CoA ligase family protein/GNAT family N-acetyltransferase [Erwinia tracheiphila]UIA90907.1 bifunctional acetate--CoA ligase family protein/GNAT family N-acetyltransferase [Erwinia tracheiphila]